jgi:hypothetical protein
LREEAFGMAQKVVVEGGDEVFRGWGGCGVATGEREQDEESKERAAKGRPTKERQVGLDLVRR